MATTSPVETPAAEERVDVDDRRILERLHVLGGIGPDDLVWVDDDGSITLDEPSLLRPVMRSWSGQDRGKTAHQIKVIVDEAVERYEVLASTRPDTTQEDVLMRLAQHTSNMEDALKKAAKGITTLATHYETDKKGSNAYISLQADAKTIQETLLRVSTSTLRSLAAPSPGEAGPTPPGSMTSSGGSRRSRTPTWTS